MNLKVSEYIANFLGKKDSGTYLVLLAVGQCT